MGGEVARLLRLGHRHVEDDCRHPRRRDPAATGHLHPHRTVAEQPPQAPRCRLVSRTRDGARARKTDGFVWPMVNDLEASDTRPLGSTARTRTTCDLAAVVDGVKEPEQGTAGPASTAHVVVAEGRALLSMVNLGADGPSGADGPMATRRPTHVAASGWTSVSAYGHATSPSSPAGPTAIVLIERPEWNPSTIASLGARHVPREVDDVERRGVDPLRRTTVDRHDPNLRVVVHEHREGDPAAVRGHRGHRRASAAGDGPKGLTGHTVDGHQFLTLVGLLRDEGPAVRMPRTSGEAGHAEEVRALERDDMQRASASSGGV